MKPAGDRFPPGKRSKQVNVRIRQDVYTAAVDYAKRYGIPLAAAVDHLLSSHPALTPKADSK